jgi:hypothetical protein
VKRREGEGRECVGREVERERERNAAFYMKNEIGDCTAARKQQQKNGFLCAIL